MASLESVTSLLLFLPNSENKTLTLNEIRTALISLSPSALAALLPDLSFSVIFEYLNTTDRKQLESCCDVLQKLLAAANPSVILPNFHAELLAGLSHESTCVKELCLYQVGRVADNHVQQVVQYADVIEMVVELLGDESTVISKKAAVILVCLARSYEGVELLFNNVVQTMLLKVSHHNDVVKFRVYEVTVDVIVQSQDAIQFSRVDDSLLNKLINEMDKNDMLAQLNCLELLTRLAICDHGMRYLDERRVFNRLENILIKSETDALAGFIMPGIIKFFGSICHVNPNEMCARFKPFMKMIFTAIETNNESLLGIAVETVGLVGKSADGKRALDKQDGGCAMHACCETIGNLIKNPPIELRLKCLETISQLLFLPVDDQSSDLLSTTEDWFLHLSKSDPLTVLISIAQQPFLDIRTAGLNVIQTIANLPWGQKRLHEHPGFEEYLLDRRTEHTKEGVEGKYKIVQTLVHSSTASDIFGWPYFSRLREYEREGPFYSRAETQIAFESAE